MISSILRLLYILGEWFNLLDNLYKQPDSKLFEIASELDKSAIIFDVEGIRHTVNIINEDIGLIENAFLHLAVKSIHNIRILDIFAELGLGCDVASIGEFELVKSRGFRKITTTSPYYDKDSMKKFIEYGIIMDLDSLDQLHDFIRLNYSKKVGLRISIPIPEEMDTVATFGKDSRFGINYLREKKEILDLFEKKDLIIESLHVHTGQSTVSSLEYKIRFLLNIASEIHTVRSINLGGGLFYLFNNRKETRDVFIKLNLIIREWEEKHQRSLEIIFEPGGALLTGNGYLVSEIISKKYHEKWQLEILQCDVSFWNLSPWIKTNPIVLNVNESEEIEKVIFVGNTLYEGDVLGDFTSYLLPKAQKGNKVLFPAYGAYSLTNSREFNKLDLPEQYIFQDKEITLIGENK